VKAVLEQVNVELVIVVVIAALVFRYKNLPPPPVLGALILVKETEVIVSY
jgi:hypothetical protein